MKAIIFFLIAFTNASYAYTLNLNEYSKYENKKCTLELGKKVYRKAIHYGQSNVTAQDAVLITAKAQYTFEIIEREEITNQKEFGQVEAQIFPTTIYLKKEASGLNLKLIMENWQGWTDLLLDCGNLKLVK